MLQLHAYCISLSDDSWRDGGSTFAQNMVILPSVPLGVHCTAPNSSSIDRTAGCACNGGPGNDDSTRNARQLIQPTDELNVLSLDSSTKTLTPYDENSHNADDSKAENGDNDSSDDCGHDGLVLGSRRNVTPQAR